jgi:hypothetical protein
VSRFVVLTKTRWTEPPRLRHQVARLLANGGHDVLFVEKPTIGRPSPARRPAQHVTVVGHRELLHHKLRLTSPLQSLNASVTGRSIVEALRGADTPVDDAVVVNFNYDYWFLRRIFPRNVIVTVINDDFVSRGVFGITRHLRRALARTCAISDHVLTVSTQLQEDLAPYAAAELFLPWADRPYILPPAGLSRNTLLFWGFINRRLDFPLVESLADRLVAQRPDLKLLFVGPVEQGVEAKLDVLRSRPNVAIQAAAPLDDLPLDSVCASIVPYLSAPDLDVCLIPNKALQLFARGIPLLVSGLPRIMKAPFVFRIDVRAPEETIDTIRRQFDAIQPAIQAFVSEQQASARLDRLEAIADAGSPGRATRH